MTNLLNTYLVNNSAKAPQNTGDNPLFTFNTEGKVKPLEYKGKLLPSKIIGSPIEYAKDLKKDIVSIGKAAKGQANDHELGRINDFAMKLGSLGLATYLFVKNPLKLSKAMEFAGFGTFFASMALWPKLAIQLPIKLRTGVDIHRKYIDSQGRKKMLHQDPQYVLTDLYTREDLDKMGKKLKVSENIPDRDKYIKQRAQKIATQGNTLWMMTAGIATPIMSALSCNVLEKPLNKIIEKSSLVMSEKGLLKGNKFGLLSKSKMRVSAKEFDKFLSENAESVLDEKMINKLASKMGMKVNSAIAQSAIAEELASLGGTTINEAFVRNVLKDHVAGSVFDSLATAQKAELQKAIENSSFEQIGRILSQATGATGRAQIKLGQKIERLLSTAETSAQKPKIGQVAESIKNLYSRVSVLGIDKKPLDNYIEARVGDKSGTYIANQWGRISNSLMKSLNFSEAELKQLAQIKDTNSDEFIALVTEKFGTLASDSKKFDKAVRKLMKLIGDYENVTGEAFTNQVKSQSDAICSRNAGFLQSEGFGKLAEKIYHANKNGNVNNVINVETGERILGARSSFYRLLQFIDIRKQITDGTFKQELTSKLKENGQEYGDDVVEKLTKVCQDLLLKATPTDYVEKLKSANFGLSESEYKVVLDVLFGESSGKTIEQALGSGKTSLLDGFRQYKKKFMSDVVNWENSITPQLKQTVSDASKVTSSPNAVERCNLTGKSVAEYIQKEAKQKLNSMKWLKIFGGVMIGLTVLTLIGGLVLGRKSKAEKQAEEESKVNG